MSDTILELLDVSLAFKGLKAIDGLSFAVRRGEICALIGPNGAGKSSLLNILNGVYRAGSGTVVFEGERFHRMEPLKAARRGIGRTFQHAALFGPLSVIDNVLAGLARHSRTTLVEHAFGLPRDAAETRRFLYGWFPRLKARRGARAGLTSGGEQQMVAIGRALMTRPTLLLLDEPSMGLAPIIVAEIFATIARLNREEGLSVLIAEQSANLVLDHADRAIVLEGGRVVATGSGPELAAGGRLAALYLGGHADPPTRH